MKNNINRKTNRMPGILVRWGFLLICCIFCLPAVGQEYSAKDSALFQKSLMGSLSALDRIHYQLRLAEYSIRKPGSFKADLDNARIWIDKSKKLNEGLKSREAAAYILFEECYLQGELGQMPKTKAMLETVIAMLKNGENKYLLGNAYRELANYYDGNDGAQLNQKIELVKTAIVNYKACGDKLKTGATLQYLADLYLQGGNTPKALTAMNEGLAVFTSVNYPRVQGLYDLLGLAYYTNADFTNSVKYWLLALKTTEMLKDSSMQACEIYNHLGVGMNQLRQEDKAITYFRAALTLAKKNNDVRTIFMLTSNIANNYHMTNKPKEGLKLFDETIREYKIPQDLFTKQIVAAIHLRLLADLKQFQSAQIYVDELLTMTKAQGITSDNLMGIYGYLIDYYYRSGNYNNQLVFLLKNGKLTKQIRRPAENVRNLSYWYKMDSVKHDYTKAFFHLSEYKKLQDSIFNEKKSRQIAQLQVGAETQKKEDEIRLKSKDIKILTQNGKIDQEQLKRAQLTRNVTLAGVFGFILITGMQYRRYQEKQKLNVLITDKNTALQKLVTEKEWLLKEVHHRVKNNLHTVICLLESQAAHLENDALKAIESSQHRIFAMSLIHQRLYQSTDIQTIDTAVYLPEFIMYLRESFGEPLNITFQQEIDAIRLAVSQAIPIALIVNEAVTNAIKYAFPENKTGTIKVSLLNRNGNIELTIEDNGIGMPEIVDPNRVTSLGLELIRGLTDDLMGEISFIIEKGTRIVVTFKRSAIVVSE